MNADHRRRRGVRLLLACGLAPAVFAVLLLIQGAVRPAYDPVRHFGSELSLGPWGWLQVTNFIVTGLLTLAFAVGLRRVLAPGRGAVAAPVLTAVFGGTLVVAGLFTTDPLYGYPPDTAVPTEPTVAGLIHNLNALPNFIAMAATTFVMAARFAQENGKRTWMWYSLVTGLAVLVTFLASVALYTTAEQAGALATSPHGIWQRICIVVGFGWFSALAVELLRPDAVGPAGDRTDLLPRARGQHPRRRVHRGGVPGRVSPPAEPGEDRRQPHACTPPRY
jgi:hypothetical membrane protein